MKKNEWTKGFIFIIFLLAGGFLFKYLKGQNPNIKISSLSSASPAEAAKLEELEITGASPKGKGPFGDAAPGAKFSAKINTGGREWDLNFEDQSIPDESKRLICSDLNLVFGHIPRIEIDKLVTVITTQDGNILDRRIRFEGAPQTMVWNKIFYQTGYFGCLLRGASDTELFIPRLVSKAYLRAIEIVKMNEEAMIRLGKFLERMNRIATEPIEDVRGIFVFSDDNKIAEGGTAKVDPLEFAKAWGGKFYRAPSILDFMDTTGHDFSKYGVLSVKTYIIEPERFTETPPLVYTDGKWKFLMLRGE